MSYASEGNLPAGSPALTLEWVRADNPLWWERNESDGWEITIGKVTLHDGREGPSVVLLWHDGAIDSMHDTITQAKQKAEKGVL